MSVKCATCATCETVLPAADCACPACLPGFYTPGMFDSTVTESFGQWERRLEAWLATLPKDHPALDMGEIDQCAAFENSQR